MKGFGIGREVVRGKGGERMEERGEEKEEGESGEGEDVGG